jgi:Trk K+ transport system NAD-binding subunit
LRRLGQHGAQDVIHPELEGGLEVDLRAQTGASIIAVIHEQQVMANSKPNTRFAAGDIVALIGNGEQIAAVAGVLNAPTETIDALKV